MPTKTTKRSKSVLPPWLRGVRRVVVFLGALYVAWLIAGCALQRKMIFPREYADQVPLATEGINGLEQIWIETPEGKVEAWYMPGFGRIDKRPGPAVIFAHGNAELIDHNAKALMEYRYMGIGVLLCEYRGYGRSAGSPSQAAITDDFIKAYDWLAARPEVKPDEIIFHGRSLGGGVVCSLAQHRKPAALIVQSTFISMKKMAAKYALPAFVVSDPFDNEAAMQSLDCPMLIFHGERDSIIPFAHGEHLASVAKGSTFIKYDCDHNDFPPSEKTYWQDIRTFLTEKGLVVPFVSSK